MLIAQPPAVDLPLELSVHLAQPDALPELHVQQLLAEPRAPLVRVQETVIIHPSIISASINTKYEHELGNSRLLLSDEVFSKNHLLSQTDEKLKYLCCEVMN